jgi:hypothetical protein
MLLLLLLLLLLPWYILIYFFVPGLYARQRTIRWVGLHAWCASWWASVLQALRDEAASCSSVSLDTPGMHAVLQHSFSKCPLL